MKTTNFYLTVFLSSFSLFVSAQKLPKIDLSLWKLTLPEGAAKTFKGEKLLAYSANTDILKYMFNDPNDRSLVFYAYPSMTSKRSFTKTELKEQNAFGNDVNWTFKEGAKFRAVARMGEISKKNEKNPRVIFVQIGGRLNDVQIKSVGTTGKDAPAILKVYWDNGFIKLRSKKLLAGVEGDAIFREESWVDDDGFVFKDEVGQDKFTLDIEVSDGKMEVTLNKREKKVYSGDNYTVWNAFDNYFTVGCNLQSEEVGAYANMKFYTLEVVH